MAEAPNSGPIAAVVFDAVGTLIDPAPSVAVAYAEAALRQGVRLELEVVRSRFGQAFRRDEIDESRGPMSTDEGVEYRRWRRIVGAVMPEVADLDQAFDELWEHFARPSSWRCFDDVPEALDGLRRAGVAVRVGSNFDGRLRGVLRGLPSLGDLAETAIVSSAVGFRKPHPAFYRAACESLGLPPSQILFVGDDPANDVDGPRSSGLKSLLLDRPRRHALSSSGMTDLASLPAYLDGAAWGSPLP